MTVFLCGDVMLGRGVDQILPHPGDPGLRERSVRDARTYVELAEAVNGPIPSPVEFSWPWGDALPILDAIAPDARVVNLETSITGSGEFAPGKGVHYRMSPGNIDSLAVVRPDATVLANNHVLDFGIRGLEETLDTLAGAGLRAVGAGRDESEAQRPAVTTVGDGRRVVVYSLGTTSSGIPPDWAAGRYRPGVDLIGVSPAGAASVAHRVETVKTAGDVVVASIHWGSNWGYGVPPAHADFAHRLIDAGVDIVHGHSSHHPRPIEVYRDKLVLYGCGDLIDDYEGIGGYEQYRDDLRLLYVASVEPDTGALAGLRMVPMRARGMRLERASGADAEWVASTLDRVSAPFGVHVNRGADDILTLSPGVATRRSPRAGSRRRT